MKTENQGDRIVFPGLSANTIVERAEGLGYQIDLEQVDQIMVCFNCDAVSQVLVLIADGAIRRWAEEYGIHAAPLTPVEHVEVIRRICGLDGPDQD